MKKKKIYISGPISSLPIDVARENFKQAIIKVKKTYPASEYEYINPFDLKISGKNPSWADYMIPCLKALKSCNKIYMMEGYLMSPGANIEKAFAMGAGIEVIHHQNL